VNCREGFTEKNIIRMQDRNKAKEKTETPIAQDCARSYQRATPMILFRFHFETELSGLVATNTTISREGLSEKSKVKSKHIGAGGLSGRR
jgi:dihydroorotate dehydrogenase